MTNSVVENRPKCVLIADNLPPTGGGVSRYYAGLAESYGAAMDVHGPPGSQLHGSACRASLPAASGRFGQLKQAVTALSVTRTTESPIVLLGHPHLGLLTRRWAARPKLGLFIHGGEWQDSPRLEGLLRRIERECDFLIANSDATATDWIAPNFGGVTYVLRPGIQDSWVDSGRTAFSHRSAHREGRPLRLLTVARLVPRKGIEEIAEIVQSLVWEGVPIELRIVGDGPLLEDLRRDFGPTSPIQCVGGVSDCVLRECYEWADAFVLCPQTIPGGDGYEGFGIVYLEAAAYGLPVVATLAGGVSEALDPKGSMTADPGDWRSVKAHLRRLASLSSRELGLLSRRNTEWAYLNTWSRRAEDFAAFLRGCGALNVRG